MTTNGTHNLPRLTLQDNSAILTQLLSDFQRILVQHPQASRAIIQAFVVEGRRFAQTEEGQQWQQMLVSSELVQRGRMIWDAYSLDALIDTETRSIPSAWLDLLIAAIANSDLEAILSTLIVEQLQNGTIDTL